jgi:hypothetical protein
LTIYNCQSKGTEVADEKDLVLLACGARYCHGDFRDRVVALALLGQRLGQRLSSPLWRLRRPQFEIVNCQLDIFLGSS